MLDGDEIIQKTIQDEQIEIRKKYKGAEEDAFGPSQVTVQSRRSQRQHRRLIQDDGLLSSDEQDQNEDEFTLNDRRSRSLGSKKKHEKKGRSKNSPEFDDNAEGAVFIDNLPKDESTLNQMIKEVNWHIRDLEKKFFYQEDSEVEEDLKQNQNISEAEHNQQLQQLLETSHIKQFWTIPMSENTTDLNFEKLAASQKK